jgi:DNA-binding transcriptional MocR family regulator
VAWLPPGLDDIEAVHALSPEGFACLPLSEVRRRPGGRDGLVLGFAGMNEELIRSSIQRMAEILRPLARR